MFIELMTLCTVYLWFIRKNSHRNTIIEAKWYTRHAEQTQATSNGTVGIIPDTDTQASLDLKMAANERLSAYEMDGLSCTTVQR